MRREELYIASKLNTEGGVLNPEVQVVIVISMSLIFGFVSVFDPVWISYHGCISYGIHVVKAVRGAEVPRQDFRLCQGAKRKRYKPRKFNFHISYTVNTFFVLYFIKIKFSNKKYFWCCSLII